nr:MAG TPA: hypothetical protein [Caudoviricetes sp.]
MGKSFANDPKGVVWVKSTTLIFFLLKNLPLTI